MNRNFSVLLMFLLFLVGCSADSGQRDLFSGAGAVGAAGKAGSAGSQSGGFAGVGSGGASGSDAGASGSGGTLPSAGTSGSGGSSGSTAGSGSGGASGSGGGGASGGAGSGGASGSGMSGSGGTGCTPKTCVQSGTECGLTSDGCGKPLDCGKCAAPLMCGAFAPNKCGCKPKTKAEACGTAFVCGDQSDGCTGTVTCGTCVAPYDCQDFVTPGGQLYNKCGTNCVYSMSGAGTSWCATGHIWECGSIVPSGCLSIMGADMKKHTCCPSGPM